MTGTTPRYYYTVYPQAPAPGRVTTSRVEITHILIAYAVLTFDLVLILSGSTFLAQGSFALSFSIYTVALAAAAALTGFLAHEMAHKIAAQRRHSWAEFRMYPFGLVFSVFTAIFGFLFAAPGATMVGGMQDRRAWGETSLAGPVTNLGFATAFLIGASVLGAGASTWPWFVALITLAFFNGWFALFNLLPFGPLDGRKVMSWSKSAWVCAIAASLVVTILAYVVASSGKPFAL